MSQEGLNELLLKFQESGQQRQLRISATLANFISDKAKVLSSTT